MAVEQRYKVTHKDLTDDSTKNIVEIYDTDTEEGITASMDSFQFRVLLGVNPTRTFDINDEINIYFEEGSDDPSTLVMNGIITEVTYDLSVDGMVVTVRGVNRIERLLFSPSPANYPSDFQHTDANSVVRTGWDAIVTHLIDRANEYKPDDDDTSITYDVNSVPILADLEEDYWTDWKSIHEHLEWLSSAEWTPNKVNYFFELDTANKLHFRSKDDATYGVAAGTIDLDGATVLSCSVTRGIFDVINALLVNCGVDSAGNTVFAHYYDGTSIGKFGAKFKYIKKEQIASTYLSQFDSGSEPAVATQRTYIRNEGRRYAKSIVTQRGEPRFKIDLDLQGSTTYTRGKIYKIESSEIGYLGTTEPLRLMRVVNIVQRFSARSGWTTRLHLEEDEKTLQIYGG